MNVLYSRMLYLATVRYDLVIEEAPSGLTHDSYKLHVLQISDILSEFLFNYSTAKMCKYSDLKIFIKSCDPVTITDVI